jgi:hypothetical protein
VSPSFHRAVLAALACGACTGGQAGDAVLTDGPQAALHVAPRDPALRRFHGVDGDSSQKSPSWYFAQWGIPEELPGGVRTAPGADWEVANPHARVAWLAQARAYELAQNGAMGALPCGAEENLFLAPTTPNDYPRHAVGMLPSLPLSQLVRLEASFGLDVAYERVEQRCLTAPNYAAYAVALVLTDDATPEPQTLFYQVMLRDSRGLAVAKRWCPGYEDADSPVFCVDDSLGPVYGQPGPVVGGGRRAYVLDLLPQLRNVLATRHAKSGAPARVLDGDASHWHVTGLYYGQIIMGGAVPTSRWDAYSLRESW